jgi:hypothetical protein
MFLSSSKIPALILFAWLSQAFFGSALACEDGATPIEADFFTLVREESADGLTTAFRLAFPSSYEGSLVGTVALGIRSSSTIIAEVPLAFKIDGDRTKVVFELGKSVIDQSAISVSYSASAKETEFVRGCWPVISINLGNGEVIVFGT